MPYKKYKPSSAARAKYAAEQSKIDEYLKNNPSIYRSRSGDSYYFSINGNKYRVSNHSVSQSDNGMVSYDTAAGKQKLRDSYHKDTTVIEILAGKTRIIEIYEAIKNGESLDYRGRIIKKEEKI